MEERERREEQEREGVRVRKSKGAKERGRREE